MVCKSCAILFIEVTVLDSKILSQVHTWLTLSSDLVSSIGFCCQVPTNPAYGRKTVGVKFSVFRTAYAARATGALLSFATSLNEPITVVSHRAKANIFKRPSILFRPLVSCKDRCFGGVAGYRPRVRSVYYMRVYHHSLPKPA